MPSNGSSDELAATPSDDVPTGPVARVAVEPCDGTMGRSAVDRPRSGNMYLDRICADLHPPSTLGPIAYGDASR